MNEREKLVTDMLEKMLKGRTDEKTRNDEVYATIRQHHGAMMARAAGAHVRANTKAIELIGIVSVFVPDELRSFVLETLSEVMAEPISLAYAFATLAERPLASEAEHKRINESVQSLVKPLLDAMGDTRKREMRNGNETMNKFFKGEGDA